ncbi:hypothetical protein [Candidatus Poriferisodalis sp.]|uniref:hypothetical protein n=1 Tax=Candidatus Poriferisodalis sp. TaxID=3101277 RepID=UPI003B01FF0C
MGGDMAGPVEVDETYVGGKAKNMHAVDRERRIPAGVGWTRPLQRGRRIGRRATCRLG